MTKAQLSLHPETNHACLSVRVNNFTRANDGMDFNTIVMAYGGAEVTMYFRNPESFVSSLKNLIDCAQAQLDTMVPSDTQEV